MRWRGRPLGRIGHEPERRWSGMRGLADLMERDACAGRSPAAGRAAKFAEHKINQALRVDGKVTANPDCGATRQLD
jgi:hypothetical protein